MNQEATEDTDLFDLIEIVRVFAKKWYYIVIFSLILGLAGGVFATLSYKPKYSSSVSFVLHSNETEGGAINVGEVSRYSSLVDTFAVALLYNDAFCASINELAGTSEFYSDKQVSSMFSYSQVLEQTPTMKVTVTSGDPVVSYNLATQFMLHANEELTKNFNIGVMDVFNAPALSASPVNSPRSTLFALLGVAVGFVLSLAFFVIRKLRDTTVHGEADLEQIEGCPLLGIVPSFHSAQSKKKYGFDGKEGGV